MLMYQNYHECRPKRNRNSRRGKRKYNFRRLVYEHEMSHLLFRKFNSLVPSPKILVNNLGEFL